MKREGQKIMRCKQPIKIEKLLHCSRHFFASFVKEITLPFSKLKLWLKPEKTASNLQILDPLI